MIFNLNPFSRFLLSVFLSVGFDSPAVIAFVFQKKVQSALTCKQTVAAHAKVQDTDGGLSPSCRPLQHSLLSDMRKVAKVLRESLCKNQNLPLWTEWL